MDAAAAWAWLHGVEYPGGAGTPETPATRLQLRAARPLAESAAGARRLRRHMLRRSRVASPARPAAPNLAPSVVIEVAMSGVAGASAEFAVFLAVLANSLLIRAGPRRRRCREGMPGPEPAAFRWPWLVSMQVMISKEKTIC